MNYSTYRFNLDMQSDVSQVSLSVRQNSTAIKLRINLTDGGLPYTIENGCTAVFLGKRADGNPLMNYCIIEKNTTICYEFNEHTAACPGIVDSEIRVYDTEGKLITSPRFIIVVDSRAVCDCDFTLSEEQQTVLDNIIVSENARREAEAERVESFAVMTKKVEDELNNLIDDAEKAAGVVAELEQRLKDEDIGSAVLSAHNENEYAHEKAFKVQFGKENVKGLKGYWIEGYVAGTSVLQVYLSPKTIRSEVPKPITQTGYGDPSVTLPYAVGDEVSIITPKDHYLCCGKITSIYNNRVIVSLSGTEVNLNAGDPVDNNDYAFFVPSKPDVGIIDVSEGGFATGIGTRAGGEASTSSGVGTTAIGDYSDAGGLKTRAGYCGFSRGSKNEADAKYSSIPGGFENKVGVNGQQGFIGGGNGNEVDAYSGSARNGRNKVYADYGDGSGFGNTIEKDANASSLSGQHNTIKAGAHSVDGAGYGNTAERSALAGFFRGIANLLKSKAGYVGGEDCQSDESWYQFLHGHGLRGGKKLAQALFGRYNKINDKAAFQVGNGVLDTARSNAFEILSERDSNGNNVVSMVLGNTEVSEAALIKALALVASEIMIASGSVGYTTDEGKTKLYLPFNPKLVVMRSDPYEADNGYADRNNGFAVWVAGSDTMWRVRHYDYLGDAPTSNNLSFSSISVDIAASGNSWIFSFIDTNWTDITDEIKYFAIG